MGEKFFKKATLIVFTLFFAVVVCGAASAANADVQVNQTVNNTAPNYGDNVKFTDTVSNNGPNNATGVQVTDKLPTGLIYVSDDSNGAYNYSTGIWNVGSLNYGTTKSLNIIAKVNDTGTIKNTASKTAENETDPNLNNDAQQTVLNVPKAVDISVDQYSWYPTGTYNCDNTPVFVVDVRNEGNDDATNVVVSYKVGNGYEYIGANTRGVGTATYNANTRTVTWTIPYMPKSTTDTPEAIAFMNIYLRIIETGTQTTNLTNTAALVSVDQHDTNTANNQTSAAITVPTSADIQVNQNVTGTPNYNGTVTITVTATNNGPNNSTGVTIKDLLPNGLQYVSSTASQGIYDPSTGIWSLGNFTYGTGPQTLTIVAKIISTGTIKNVASLTAPLVPNFTDWNYDNNAQQCIITVPDAADVQVNQTTDKTSYNLGDTVTVTVTVKNNGPDNASGVSIKDLLPTGLNYSSSTASTGSYDNTTGIWKIGNLNNGSTVTLTITAIATALNNIINTASKNNETQYDPNLNNDAQSVTLNVADQVTHFTNEGTTNGTVNSDDGTTSAIKLPFNVTLYGQTYDTIYININGLVSFGTPVTGPYFTDSPSSSIAYVAPFWSDIDVTYAGNITYNVTSNQIIITWNNVPGYSQGSDPTEFNTFSLIMTSDGKFAFVYGDLQWSRDTYDETSFAGISKGDGSTPKKFWTSSRSLNRIANSTIWFDSNGNRISG